MDEVKPDDLRFTQVIRVSKTEFDACPERFKSMAEARMRGALADFIQRERAETVVDEHYIEKRIELYVATPKQFWRMVHEEAQQIALRWAPR